jgi:2-amino-4-hydroxy-6-hydroxymethyldihydropteridine diphosphokinase
MNANDHLALIALGSNLGDSADVIAHAFKRLATLSREPIVCSSLWQTTPVDCPPGSPVFVNAAVALKPLAGETPESLLEKLLAWEKEFGRRPKVILNEARPLDLDLIAFGQETRRTTTLTLPHPRAHLRQFVLQPLAEVAPEFALPNQPLTIAQLLENVPLDPAMKRLC